MKLRDILIWSVLVASCGIVAGCASYGTPTESIAKFALGGDYDLSNKEMRIGPSKDKYPQKFFALGFVLNPEEDLVSFDRKIIAWTVPIWKGGKEERYLGLRFGWRDNEGRSILFSMIPHSLAEYEGAITGYTSHCGERLYNKEGKYAVINNPRRIHPERHKDLLSVIKSEDKVFVMELDASSEVFAEIMGLYQRFWINKVLEEIKGFSHEDYITSLSKAEWDELTKEESFKSRAAEFFGKDWTLLFTIPLSSVSGMGLNAIAAKLIQIPNLLRDEIDRVGCLYHKMDAVKTAAMIEYHAEEYVDPRLNFLYHKISELQSELAQLKGLRSP